MLTTSHSERMTQRTVTGKVYSRIKDDIINGFYPPGTHLVRRTLAKKYGVSPLPIMEAFFRLENDGLVENTPGIGCHVINFNEETIAEEYKYREALECYAARQFVLHASELEKQQVMALAGFLDTIQDNMQPDDRERIDAFHKHHSEFHLSVAKFSRAKIVYHRMRKPWFRRAMYAGNNIAVLFPVPNGWHVSLMRVLEKNDPDKAEQAMRFHLTYKTNLDSIREMVRRNSGSELIDHMLDKEEED